MRDKWRFFYHWVRATNKWSVHFRTNCIHTDHIECNVPCESKINTRQPYRVMQGFAKEIEVHESSDGMNVEKIVIK